MWPEVKPLFEFLLEVNRRPEPFAEYTAGELWTDPHTSRRMLALHLDPADAASRNREFLDRSADTRRGTASRPSAGMRPDSQEPDAQTRCGCTRGGRHRAAARSRDMRGASRWRSPTS